jgi:adenylate cyclase
LHIFEKKIILKIYTTIILLFLSFVLKAQESATIIGLKSKLDTASTLGTRTSLQAQLSQAYFSIQKFDSAIVYIDKMLSANAASDDKDKLASMNVWMSQQYLMKGKPDAAYPYLSKAEKLLENSNEINQISGLNYLLGAYYFLKKEIKKGEEYYKKNIDLYNQGKAIDKNLVMASYQALFSTNFVQNNLKNTFEAINNYYDFVKINFPDKLNEANFMLGLFYVTSITAFRRSLSLNKKENISFDFQSRTFLASAYVESNKLDSAKYFLNGNKEFFEKSGNTTFLATVHYVNSQIQEKEYDFDKAEENILKAIELAPAEDIQKAKASYQNQLYVIQLGKLFQDSLTLKTDSKKQNELKEWLGKLENSSKNIEGNIGAQYGLYENYEKLAKGYEYLANYDLALFYLKKSIASKNVVYDQEKLREFSDFESEYTIKIEQSRIKLEEETKRLELEKQIALKAVKFEFEKKQALAKTEEEKKRLVLEEELKRKLILVKYEEKQKEITLKFNQEKEIIKINQEKKDALAKAEIENSKYMKNMWALGMALSLALLGFAGFSYYQKQKDNKKIANEKQKSDELLLNILPYEVAEELKLNGESSAKHYDEVSVLFTDFVNFTQKSEALGVQKMLNELNVCFTEFDKIMEKHGLEKIKTIGDAYLAVSGLPSTNDNHAQNAVKAGLEILEFINKKKSLNENSFEIRIGIHSGPVIAGIVGVKKFAYDIWGDTVNTAARMEQNGVKGKLNVSGSTYTLIHEKYDCEYRGKIETKGKGALDMYFVNKSI